MAETDPNPGPPPATANLRRLYSNVADLIALHEVSNASRVVINRDIEIPLPQNVKDQITARIVAKTAQIEAQVAALKNGK